MHIPESHNRELKQTDAAAASLQISIQNDSRPSEFSRPLTSIILNLNGICLLAAAASVCLSSLMLALAAMKTPYLKKLRCFTDLGPHCI